MVVVNLCLVSHQVIAAGLEKPLPNGTPPGADAQKEAGVANQCQSHVRALSARKPVSYV